MPNATIGKSPAVRRQSIRVLKNGASGRDPALRGFCKCSHLIEYAALSKTPRAWADGLILVFQHPASAGKRAYDPGGAYPDISRVRGGGSR
jgi:hypothetical protein